MNLSQVIQNYCFNLITHIRVNLLKIIAERCNINCRDGKAKLSENFLIKIPSFPLDIGVGVDAQSI